MNLKYALRSEDTEQIAVITWAQWNMQRYPELELLHHVPNLSIVKEGKVKEL